MSGAARAPRRTLRWLASIALATGAPQAGAAPQPFFADAVPVGSIELTLHSTEVVAANTSRLVTFGMPFPRGSITAAGLSTLRVLRNGVEVPAHVEPLTPWRHRSDPARNETSVRVARIQIEHTFDAAYPDADAIVVSWGGVPRTAHRTALVDPRTAWHRVEGGSFEAVDGVMEPDVYAVLPADWMARGVLKSSRSLPFEHADPTRRDTPAQMAAVATWPGFQEAERAHKNNFYTIINRDDDRVAAANRIPYRDDAEPWLYDRAATMFVLYFRSGSFTALREAVRNAQFYADRLGADALFDLSSDDMKYSYNESLAYTYWLTGDATLLDEIDSVPLAYAGLSHAWSPSVGFWAERHVAFKLLARTVAYEVLGGAARANAVDQMLAALSVHQDGANGQIPLPRIDGGFYHTGLQHRDWDERLGASSWMSALLSDALVRAYATDDDAAAARMIVRLGNFMRATVVLAAQQYDGQLRAAPLYAMRLDGSDATPSFGPEEEHALNVAAQIPWAYYFSAVLGEPMPALRQTAMDLYATYDRGVNFWIRPNGPANGLAAYRVVPPRKWGWEHRTSDGIGFALAEATAGVAPIFRNGFEE